MVVAAVAAAVEDSMDMDKVGYSIGRMLPLRNPQCRESNNYVLINLGACFIALLKFARLPACSLLPSSLYLLCR